MCVFPPLGSHSDGGISLGALSQRGFEDKRNHTTDPTDISRSPVSPFSPSYSIFHLEVDTSFVPAHGFHFPFPLQPTAVSISTLPRFLSFSPAFFFFLSPPCHPVHCLHPAFICHSAPLHFSLPSYRLFSCQCCFSRRALRTVVAFKLTHLSIFKCNTAGQRLFSVCSKIHMSKNGLYECFLICHR